MKFGVISITKTYQAHQTNLQLQAQALQKQALAVVLQMLGL
jgi:hypothetical protein